MKRGTTALDLEIVKEQAESLGQAGKKLQEAIDRYRRANGRQPAGVDTETHLNEIAARAWALLVQRELVGFTQENLRWVRERFDIPTAALGRMGQRSRDPA